MKTQLSPKLVLASVLFLCACSIRKEPSSAMLDVLSVIPVDDLETFLAIDGPLAIPVDLTKADNFMLFFLSHIPERLMSSLRGRRIEAAVLAAKNFNGPQSEGENTFDGAYVIRFSTHLMNLDDLMIGRKPEARKSAHCWSFDVSAPTQRWTFFISQPDPATLVVSTEHSFHESVVARTHLTRDRNDLGKWREYSKGARLWGVRWFKKETSMRDQGSPLHPYGFFRDAGAISVSFRSMLGSEEFEVKYLTKSAKKPDLPPGLGSKSSFKAVADGNSQAEMHIPFGRNKEGLEGILFLRTLLGFGVVI